MASSPSMSADCKDGEGDAPVHGIKQISPEMLEAARLDLAAGEPKNTNDAEKVEEEIREEDQQLGSRRPLKYDTDEGQGGMCFLPGSFKIDGMAGTAFVCGNVETLGNNVFSAVRVSFYCEDDDLILELGNRVLINGEWYAFAYCLEKPDGTVRCRCR
jgi:hypothetical protein